MYKFHITGFSGNGSSYWSDQPVDVTVFAENQRLAILKAENILGHHISTSERKIVIEEMAGEG